MFPIQKITSFSYPVSAFIVHLLVMYTGLMILTKSLIKDKILSIPFNQDGILLDFDTEDNFKIS